MTVAHSKILYAATVTLLSFGIGTAVILADERGERATQLPEGTMLIGGLDQAITTATARAGDGISITTLHPVRFADGGELPAGATIRGTVTLVARAARPTAGPQLTLQFAMLDVRGQTYAVAIDPFVVRGARGAAHASGVEVTGVPDGREVWFHHPSSGPAIGTGAAVAMRDGELVLPAGKPLRVYLSAPVTVQVPPGDEAAEPAEDEREGE